MLARLAGRGATMLIITHELQALLGVLTRIVELKGGQITFDGTPSDHDLSYHAMTTSHEGHHHHDDEAPRTSAAAGPLDHVPGGRGA